MPVRVGTESAPYSPCRHPGGQRHGGLYHCKLRVTNQKCRDLLLVLCRVDGAGGVHQPAARFEQLCRRIEDGRLRGQ